MMHINLIRQRKARGRSAGAGERALIAMGAAVLLAIGGMVAAYVNAEADLTAAVRANNRIKDDIERLKSEVGDYDKLKTEREALMKQGKTIEALRTGRTGAVYMLRELSEILTPHKGPTFDRITYEDRLRRDPNVGFNAGWDPRRVWLESFEEAQHKIRIRGSARTNEDVAEFLKRLQLSVFFSDVTPESTNQVTDSAAAGGTKHVTFNVTASVEY